MNWSGIALIGVLGGATTALLHAVGCEITLAGAIIVGVATATGYGIGLFCGK